MHEPVHLTRHDPACNMARFYQLDLTPDLFGGTQLIRRWGRIGTDGQISRAWFNSTEAALIARDGWVTRKARRGYRPA
ncbi:WGR domain-containing protein [uncultured Paracoccus sp.]|uniref:WGR domain-containing protein n=1 Tax=uncultured Paracoccus sp. TaxID=189685 RepID=UPI002611938A|nr:WGR domain-containing protein [uncultured Paracoccus sp.]